jgi:hypothetical protein
MPGKKDEEKDKFSYEKKTRSGPILARGRCDEII